jgi:N4-gp56 family major capsid protein
MPNINRTNFATAIKNVYEKKLLIKAAPRFVHGSQAKVATFKGGSYELRRYGQLAAITAALPVEGVTPAEHDAPSVSTVTLTPEWYGTWIGHTDQIKAVEYDDVVAESVDALGIQAGLSFDTILRNAMTDGATKLYANYQTQRIDLDDTNDKLKYKDLLRARVTLMNANAIEPSGGVDVILHPFSFNELMLDTDFLALFKEEAPGSAMRTAKVGRLLGMNILVTSNARGYVGGGASSGDDVYDALFVAEEAVGVAGYPGQMPNLTAGMGSGEYANNTNQKVKSVDIIVKELGSSGTQDPLDQRASVGWKATYDDAILNQAFIVSLEHCVTN